MNIQRVVWEQGVPGSSPGVPTSSDFSCSSNLFHQLGPRTEEFRRDQKLEMVRDFTAAHLREYETELQEAELSPATVHQYHRTLKTFLGFCAREGMLVDERVHDAMAPRVPQTEPDAYTLDEEKRLLAAARHPRDRLILSFLVATGLRLSELIHLEVEDIVDLARHGAYLRVHQGKGRKDRHVPLDGDIYRELQTYLRRVRRQGRAPSSSRGT